MTNQSSNDGTETLRCNTANEDDSIATCFFCGVSAHEGDGDNKVVLQKCDHCSLVWYCGPRHAKIHRPNEVCYPIKVARHPIKG